MSDRVSALPGALFEGAAKVAEQGLSGMITLRGDLGARTLARAIKKNTGLDVPGSREIAFEGENGLAWMSPDELLILVPYARAPQIVSDLETALADEHALVVNVSDARARFEIRGAQAAEVIAKLAPVDMQKLVPGQIRRTRLAQTAAAFWMRDAETIELICFRSVAQYVFDILSLSAREGAEVDFLYH